MLVIIYWIDNKYQVRIFLIDCINIFTNSIQSLGCRKNCKAEIHCDNHRSFPQSQTCGCEKRYAQYWQRLRRNAHVGYVVTVKLLKPLSAEGAPQNVGKVPETHSNMEARGKYRVAK